MVNVRVLTLSVATLCCAAAIGVSMQPQVLSDIAAKLGAAPAQGAGQTIALGNLPDEPDVPLVLENITLTSAPQTFQTEVAQTRAPRLNCDLDMTARALPEAMVGLAMSAPCSADTAITVHHSGVMFKTLLDSDGLAEITVPGLSANSVFLAETADGLAASVVQNVPDHGDFDRVVLQWAGQGGFELHAREFGADYGTPGHVWSGDTENGQGRLYRLGSSKVVSPLMAEVYSFPKAAADAGSVQLSVEAEVTDANCNRTTAAQTLDLRGGMLRSREVVITMPGCEAAGSFLVLNNVVENLTIAAN